MANIHYFQHVPFEDPAYILSWAKKHGHAVSATQWFDTAPNPDLRNTDLLVVMGGPMNIYEYAEYPWLKTEREIIQSAINNGKRILGICLGAQILADCLGAKVYPGPNKEIGWFEVEISGRASQHRLLSHFPRKHTAFHWHGDTFTIPENCIPIGSSEACENQGFILGSQIIALQYHIETTTSSLKALIQHCSDELVEAPFIQTAEQMIETSQVQSAGIHQLIDPLLDKWI